MIRHDSFELLRFYMQYKRIFAENQKYLCYTVGKEQSCCKVVASLT